MIQRRDAETPSENFFEKDLGALPRPAVETEPPAAVFKPMPHVSQAVGAPIDRLLVETLADINELVSQLELRA